MSKLAYIDRDTDLDIDPERVLDGAMGKLDTVVIVGWDKGDELYTAASTADSREIVFLAELLKNSVLP